MTTINKHLTFDICSALTARTSIKKSQSAVLKKETKANKEKASKRDIIVVDDKELLARNSECNVFSLSNCCVVFKM